MVLDSWRHLVNKINNEDNFDEYKKPVQLFDNGSQHRISEEESVELDRALLEKVDNLENIIEEKAEE